MKIGLFLGIEASGNSTGVAIVDDRQTRVELREPGTNHNEVLPALVDRALATAGARIVEVGGIGVTIGPGMFTALRVGLSVAKGLALPHGIPVKGVSTLLALARTVNEPARPVLALIDAHRKQVYYGLFLGDRPLLEPGVVSPEELPGLLARFLTSDREVLLAGNGSVLGEPELTRAGFKPCSTEVRLPAAWVVARVARECILSKGGDDLASLAPVYLRRTDAELQREGIKDSRSQGFKGSGSHT